MTASYNAVTMCKLASHILYIVRKVGILVLVGPQQL